MPARKKATDRASEPKKATTRRKSAVGKSTSATKARRTADKNSRQTSIKTAVVRAGASRSREGVNLVIVESPAKAKTIQKYLGPGFEVQASYGHVRDLPPKPRGGDIGIDIEAGWIPTYVNLEDERHRKVLADLKKRAAKASRIYLAPDPDREGEAIAWHLKEALKLEDDRVQRVTFNEITRKAVQEAFSHPRAIDMDRVHAQEARRFLDRAVGYKLSPLLRSKIARGLSAGRVQSVAVRLIVEREREIQAFKQEEYWKIVAHLDGTNANLPKPAEIRIVKKPQEEKKEEKKEGPPQPADGHHDHHEHDSTAQLLKPEPSKTFLAELAEWNGQKFEAKNEEQASAIARLLQGATYTVVKVEQKDKSEKAPPPFTTSTLQQQANIRLGFSAQRTMRAAQRLYEGVELGGEGAVALITYMRTDSTRVSEDALRACRDYISEHFGPAYLPASPNRFAAGKSAQEAHEAIRPTDLAYTPEQVERLLPASVDHRHDLVRLYSLIYRRFVASQMTPAIFAVTNVEVKATPSTKEQSVATASDLVLGLWSFALLKAQGKILKFDGYRKVLAPRKQEDATLPPLTPEQKLGLRDLLASQHFTQPPPRYNEASLVKALEKEGIGRPSTYATIISKIQERKYVRQVDRRFYATDLGMIVTDKLVQHFPKIMDLKFTSQMEEELDEIEERKMDWIQVLNDFWVPFSEALQSATESMEAVRGVEAGENCPRCQRPLHIKYTTKANGDRLIACSGYPECKYVKPRPGQPERPAPELTAYKCPNCQRPMVKRLSRRGPFLGCSGYPECKTIMNFDAEGKPVLANKPTEHNCDKCGKPMVLREGPRGPFLGCTGYPKCRHLVDVDAEGNPVKPIDTGVVCDKCGRAMVVKRGPRGPFLGCTGYPTCRSTKPMPQELKEKLKSQMPLPRPKKALPRLEINEVCPECGAPMELRSGRRGYFLGCTLFAKTRCKGTREVPPEVLEQVQTSAV